MTSIRLFMLASALVFLGCSVYGERNFPSSPELLSQNGLVSMTKIAEKVIDFDFFSKFNHFNKDQIVFITETEIQSYRLDLNFSILY